MNIRQVNFHVFSVKSDIKGCMMLLPHENRNIHIWLIIRPCLGLVTLCSWFIHTECVNMYMNVCECMCAISRSVKLYHLGQAGFLLYTCKLA